MTSLRLAVWLLISLLWIAGVAYLALGSWPTLPLDLPARDPQVQAALARAVRNHLIQHVAVALIPLIALLATAMWRRPKRP